MKRFAFLLPLGLLVATSTGRAQTVNIPLPPPTPLNPDVAGSTNSGTGQSAVPTATIAQKKASDYSEAELRAMGTGAAFPYELLDSVLRRFVSKNGEVSYLRLKSDNDLDTFARAVAIADLNQFPVFTLPVDPADATKGTAPDTTPELVFWINAYNGLRLKAIGDAFPIGSVSSIKEFETGKTHTVAGKKFSFADLRDKIGKMDGRALFALTTGTKDGPSAPISVFRYSGLSQQLELAVQAFVNDPAKVAAPDRLANRVEASPFLASVEPYFKKSKRRKNDGIQRVLAAYTNNGAARNYFATSDVNINYSLGNAKLNEQLSQGPVG